MKLLYYFEFEIVLKNGAKTCFSDDTAMFWDGTNRDLSGIKDYLLFSSGKLSTEFYRVRIISAMHLFGEVVNP